MDNLELDLKLTVAHVNTMLKHLGAGVYTEVADLINLLHGQAKPQIDLAVSSPISPETAPETPAAE